MSNRENNISQVSPTDNLRQNQNVDSKGSRNIPGWNENFHNTAQHISSSSSSSHQVSVDESTLMRDKINAGILFVSQIVVPKKEWTYWQEKLNAEERSKDLPYPVSIDFSIAITGVVEARTRFGSKMVDFQFLLGDEISLFETDNQGMFQKNVKVSVVLNNFEF